MKKAILSAILLSVTASTAVAADAARDAGTLYNQSCISCHMSGVANAPKTGDAAAWQSRIDEKGLDGLVATAKSGINAMPPMGMCMDCTDEELKALIEFMAQAK